MKTLALKNFLEVMENHNTNTSIFTYNLFDNLFEDVKTIEEYPFITKQNEEVTRYSLYMEDLIVDIKEDRGEVVIKEVIKDTKRNKNILEAYPKKENNKICLRGKEVLQVVNTKLLKKLAPTTTYHPKWDMKIKVDNIGYEDTLQFIYDVIMRDKNSKKKENCIITKDMILNSTKTNKKFKERIEEEEEEEA